MRANTCVGAMHEVGDRSLITADSQPRFSLRYDVPFDSFAFLRVVQSLWLSTRADIDASAFLALLANSACRAHLKENVLHQGSGRETFTESYGYGEGGQGSMKMKRE